MRTPEQIASDTHPGRLAAIAAVKRELADMRRGQSRTAGALSQRGGRWAPRTVVFSTRLDDAEVAALERQAAAVDLKPSVLVGLRDNPGPP